MRQTDRQTDGHRTTEVMRNLAPHGSILLVWFDFAEFRRLQSIALRQLSPWNEYANITNIKIRKNSQILTNISTADEFYFYPRDAMLARVLAVVVVCPCPSVCLSVRPLHAGIVLKRLIVGSRKERHTIAQRL